MASDRGLLSAAEIVAQAGGADEFLRKAASKDDFIIQADTRFGYTVRCGDRYEDQLGADEALWCVVLYLTKGTPSLRTREEHENWEKRYGNKPPLEPWQKQLAPSTTSEPADEC
jgi:hypothetical protein